MSRRYFEETQLFRQNLWVWYMFAAFSLLLIVPLLYGMYTQLILGQPWGDKPMSDNGLAILFLLSLGGWMVVAWILYSIRLEVYIDDEGVHYFYFPNSPSWKVITKDQIVSYEVRQRRNLFDMGGIGYHRNRFKKLRSMTIRGSKHIRLILPGNHKVLIGTQNPEEFDRALRRLLSNHLTE
ncbi:hypothetical protein ACFQ21_16950 [Ohtaekwangia kribbensis]|jgi:hypothetical protein|uniref:PH domain-containing protein n=1 Tax=Ohtaekwangia kribbensis TaxID=688913 RepID=A0ABW3K4U7_9BACT